MSEKAWSGNESLPLSVAQRVDAACHRFKQVWQEGGRPAIEDFLADLPERERPALLGELVPLEAAYRRNASEAPRPEDYQARFPDLDPAWLALVLLPLSDQQSAKPPSDPAGGTRTQRLRCPHCQSPIQLADSQGDVVLCPGCGSSFHVRDARQTSTRAMRQIGKFQLLERVGLGAFGAVWKARDTELDRIVALKIPHTGLLTSDTELERFHREARAAAQLRHPGIVTVHEVQTLEGLPTIVADFIHGVTLRDLLDSRRLTFREAAALIAEVAETLDYAHQMGLVHRDLKPANIMIETPRPRLDDNDLAGEEAAAEPDRIGRPLVMDFGLALRDEAETTMTTDGLVLGTPAYMSPEQAAGYSHRADRRSDVYSLGVILYELLTGEMPFRGNARLIIYQVQHEEPRPPRKLNDKIPRDLETVCLKAMAKAPGWRYATARELAEDLRRFLKGELIQARPAGRVEKGWKWARRHPAQAVAYGLVVLVLGLGGVGGAMTWLWQQAVVARQQAEGDRGQAEAARQQAEGDRGQAEAARQQAVRAREQLAVALRGEQQAKQQAEAAQEKFRQLMYLRAVDLAHREWKDNNLVRAEQLLAGCPADLRRWEWHYVHHLCHADLFTLKGHTGTVSSVAFSPDGQRLASASGDKTVKVWDTASGQEILSLKGHTGLVSSVAFSPDGRRLASASVDQTVRVWDAASGQEVLSLKGHTSYVRSVAFSPDGKRLASASGDGTVKVWDAGSGQEVLSLKGYHFSTSVAFSPEGGRLAFVGGRTVRLWDGRPLTPALQVEREARGLMDFLREQALLKADIIQRLRADPMISESVRKQALLFAEQVRDNPEWLNQVAWSVVRWQGRSLALYRQARHAAEIACRTPPENGSYLNTLGVAQYRVGRYAEAVDTLHRSHALNILNMAPGRKAFLQDLGGLLMSPWRAPGTRFWAYAQPADVAFLALAHARLGHAEEARVYRAWLRYLLQQDRWAKDDEVQAFRREVTAEMPASEAPTRR